MKDIIKNYMVLPKEYHKAPIDMKILIECIYSYIQNNEIYFKYEPSMYKSVLIFGIVGFKKNHKALKRDLGKNINDLHCILKEVKK